MSLKEAVVYGNGSVSGDVRGLSEIQAKMKNFLSCLYEDQELLQRAVLFFGILSNHFIGSVTKGGRQGAVSVPAGELFSEDQVNKLN